MPFPNPPTPPNSGQPATFNADADAFLAWMAAFANWLEAQGYPNLPQLLPNGSASAPAMSFQNSTGMGLFRVANNQLGFATGGTERARLTTSAFQIDLPITGTAVTQSPIDTAAGRLLKVGDHGIGTTATPTAGMPTDGSQIPTGFRATDGNFNGAVGLPTTCAAINMRGLANRQAQLFATIGFGDPNRFFGRTQNANDVWQPLVEFYSTGNVVGTVSESSGKPTGAIIQRGINSNGEFVRFADGTQICWREVSVELSINTAFLGGYRSAGQNTTYPAAFIAAPICAVLPINATAFGAAAHSASSMLSWSWVATAVSSQTSAPRTVQLIAIGRWF